VIKNTSFAIMVCVWIRNVICVITGLERLGQRNDETWLVQRRLIVVTMCRSSPSVSDQLSTIQFCAVRVGAFTGDGRSIEFLLTHDFVMTSRRL